MAKSLRSKWKRKMRAIKRVRYGEKELAKLNLIVDTAKNAAEASTSDDMDTDQNIVKLVSRWRPSRLAKKERLLAPRSKPKKKPDEEAMETNDEVVEVKSAIVPKYPVWLGSHRRKKLVYKNKAINKKKKKEIKKTLKKKK